MHYVYVLQSKDDLNLYIGSTSDLHRRFQEHKNGKVKSTKSRRPLELVYYEAYRAEDDALNREKQLKRRGRAKGGMKRRIEKSLLQSENQWAGLPAH